MTTSRIFAAVLIFAGGAAAGLYLSSDSEPDGGMGEPEPLYWKAPMDPNFRSHKPGKSPMGMDLVPVYAGDTAGGDSDSSIVTISPQVINNMGVRTAGVTRGELSRRIETVGYIDYDETLISHVHLRTEGWIEKLAVNSVGQRVTKGQLLLELYSPEQVNAQSEFLQVLATNQKRLIAASRERLRALGISGKRITELEKTRKVSQRIRVFAPQNGVVSMLHVREGMYVKPANDIMSLADLRRVWLLADVFERQADWVRVGQQAEVRLPYLPTKVWKGKVSYIYPSLDPKTRSLKVRLQFDNADEELKPEMFADITIFGDPRANALSIPREALIVTGDSSRVVKALGEGRFKPVEVTTGIESGDRVEILSGLAEGDMVVTSAQFLIDSESSLSAGLQRMEKAPATETDMEMDPEMDGDMSGGETMSPGQDMDGAMDMGH
ncbi:MAG: efflux RND transporter periplasmic adaptor subunit [Alphaproteobacteria bacterium]|nr:efflux RND transporter periplasmic adaptor subunit [Alphaproteobacteria bacterium]